MNFIHLNFVTWFTCWQVAEYNKVKKRAIKWTKSQNPVPTAILRLIYWTVDQDFGSSLAIKRSSSWSSSLSLHARWQFLWLPSLFQATTTTTPETSQVFCASSKIFWSSSAGVPYYKTTQHHNFSVPVFFIGFGCKSI